MTTMRLFVCAVVLLALSGTRLSAAIGESASFEVAEKYYGLMVWGRAESEFAQFIEKYPKSKQLSQAIWLQAQAQFKQGKYSEVVTLLTSRQADAGNLADRFLFWTARAQYESGNFPGAAETFGKLAREFPTSALRLEAAVSEASAYSKLGDWVRVAELLRKSDGAFRQAAGNDAGREWFARGILLLGEAELSRKNYAEAEAALNEFSNLDSKPALEWQRRYLLCRVQLESNRADAAYGTSTNLLSLAESIGRRDLAAESVAMGAEVLDGLGRRGDAVALLQRNLTNGVPMEKQRQAMTKIARLALLENKPDEACATLEDFIARFPDAPAGDKALLTLGELYLKRHLAGDGTNNLSKALAHLDRLTLVFTNSDLLGKAELNRGWCHWIAGRIPESGAAFEQAVAKLPPSEDLAVARFKLGDALYAQTNFAGALENYQAALKESASWPRTKQSLSAPALYQCVRASLGMTNLNEATAAMRAIFELGPSGAEAASSILLVTQGLVESGDSQGAQELYREFLEKLPESELRPQVELLMARAQERNGNWAGARLTYEGWLERFGTNALRSRVEFHYALATARAGDVTNALMLFTNLAASYPVDDVAPLAQWWVADFHFGRADYLKAETDYKPLYQNTNWAGAGLMLEARMMAGRSAYQRGDYLNAIEHFTNLTSNPKCPGELKAQALFAYGAALIQQAGRETNQTSRLDALGVYATIRKENPDTEKEARAWGETGNCYLQLAAQDANHYTNALNAYQQAADSKQAGIAVRSQALFGLGLVREKMAERVTGDEKVVLLKQARDHFMDVTIGTNLRPGETPDPFWINKSGLEALHVLEVLLEWDAVEKLCEDLQKSLPQQRAMWQRKIENARAQRKLIEEKS